jgi:ATP synthase protein I
MARVSRQDDGWGVLSYLLTGVFLFGGLGWLGDVLLGSGFLLPVGLVSGAALSIYTIFLRYGQDGSSAAPTAEQPPSSPPHVQRGTR